MEWLDDLPGIARFALSRIRHGYIQRMKLIHKGRCAIYRSERQTGLYTRQ
jgi:hypothetical protein